MTRVLISIFAALAISVGGLVQAETIRIGSWNIEHLGFPGSRYGDAEDIAQDPQHLAGHIEAAGVDVLALQEIGDTADPGRASETLDDVMELLNQDGSDWMYELGANKNEGDTTQLTGVAWNRSRVTKVGEPLRFSMQLPESGLNDEERCRLSDHFLIHTDIQVQGDEDEDVAFGGNAVYETLCATLPAGSTNRTSPPLWFSGSRPSKAIEIVALAGISPESSIWWSTRSTSFQPARETSDAPPLASVSDSFSSSEPNGFGSRAMIRTLPADGDGSTGGSPGS